MTKPLYIQSFGGGVQSWAMAFMFKHGYIPMPTPDFAIFADTGDEGDEVHEYMARFASELPFEIITVRRPERLSDASTRVRTSRTGSKYVKPALPVFIDKKLTTTMLPGDEGRGKRQCTYDWKIELVMRKCRELAGITDTTKELRVVQYMGISLDESIRMSEHPRPWARNEYPLVLPLRMRREDCLKWTRAHGYPDPPRSACSYCPFHSDAEWLRLKTERPAEFAFAVEYERRMQAAYAETPMRGVPYLHRSCEPLASIEFDTTKTQPSLFGNECKGFCGV